MPALLDVGEPAAEQLEHLVHRAVEQHVVIGHVEMAVVVDPGGLDPHHRGDERGKEQRFESGPIEHAGYVRGPAATRPPYWRVNQFDSSRRRIRPGSMTLKCPDQSPRAAINSARLRQSSLVLGMGDRIRTIPAAHGCRLHPVREIAIVLVKSRGGCAGIRRRISEVVAIKNAGHEGCHRHNVVGRPRSAPRPRRSARSHRNETHHSRQSGNTFSELTRSWA